MSRQPETPLGTIHNVAHLSEHAGYCALAAAMIRLALTDAQGNDERAALWLRSPACLPWLAWLATDSMSPEQLQRRLIARLPAWMR